MKSFPKVLLAVLVLALLLGLTATAMAAETKGKIKSVNADKNEFVMSDANNKDFTFHLNRDGKVFINDKEAKLSDLKADDEVNVTYEKKEDKLHASEIRCSRK